MSREAMQQALDMLNEIADDVYCDQKLEGVIAALRQALETDLARVGEVGVWGEWAGLTDEEIDAAWRSVDYTVPYNQFRIDVAREIESKLKEKNGG
jgi:hypothetical protein